MDENVELIKDGGVIGYDNLRHYPSKPIFVSGASQIRVGFPTLHPDILHLFDFTDRHSIKWNLYMIN
jgi:hypothetical protein